MHYLKQWTRLTKLERALLLRAFLTVAAARIALWFVPFRSLRAFAARPRASSAWQSLTPNRVAWAVQAAARRIPAASCLTQALACQYLLGSVGQASRIHIGIAKDRNKSLKSHAWVEYRGQIIIGDNGELESYSPIAALGAKES